MNFPHATTRNPYIGHTLRELQNERQRLYGNIRRGDEDAHISLAAVDEAIELTTDHYYADCPCPEQPYMSWGDVAYRASCNCPPPPDHYRLPDSYTGGDLPLPF